jgi:hypothetical protein
MSNPLVAAGSGRLIARTISGGGFGDFPLGYIDFIATVNGADPAAMVDGNLSMLSIDTTGRLRVVSTAAAGAIFQVQTTPAQQGDSLFIAARAVAPGAGAAFTTLVAPAAGTYEVAVTVGYDVGAPAAGEINNMKIQRGGVDLYNPIQVLSVLNNIQTYRYRITFSGAQTLSVNAIAAGTAGVGYSGAILATRVA